MSIRKRAEEETLAMIARMGHEYCEECSRGKHFRIYHPPGQHVYAKPTEPSADTTKNDIDVK